MATGRIGTTPVLQVRWSKAPSAGTTSLSGLDDNSVSLVYSVGYEAVYRNGVLLSRTNDYTATDGTTVTLIDATIAGDIIEIFANQTIPLSDTFSQTVADGRFIKNTLTTTTGDIIYASAANTPARLAIGSTGQVLKVSGGVPSWGADGGKVLQVVNQLYQTYTTSSSGTLADTGVTLNITPTSATSKVLVLVNLQGIYKSAGNAGNAVDLQLFRGATKIGGTDAALYTNSLLQLIGGSWSCTILDSPATTSATTYKVQFANDGGNNGSVAINFSAGADYSTITLMEIGA